jgi:hypothetical protein
MPGGKGWVTALAAGVTTISATDPMTGISSFTTNTSARLSVNTAALRALAVSPRSPNIHLNATVQLTASGAFTDNSTHDVTQSVTWASSNVAVADVGNSGRTRGLVTGRTVGNAIISATDPATGVSSDASNESASVNVLQPYLFIEDFEDGAIPEWTAPGPGYSAMITLGGAAMTSRSLTLSGGAATGHYMAVSRQFTGIQPSQLRFHVRTDRTDLNTGYFVVGDAGIGDPVTNNQGIIFFHFSSGAAMYLYDGIAARGRTTYQPNVWHLIECRNMSWSTRTYDIWIDGVQRDVNVPFRSATTTVVERIELYNFQPGVASFDQIIME